MVKEIDSPLKTLAPKFVKCRISKQKCDESQEKSYKIFEKITMSLFSNLIRLQDEEINEEFPDELPAELKFTEENMKHKKFEALDVVENENIEDESVGSLVSQGEQLINGQKQLQKSVEFKNSTIEKKVSDSLFSSREGETNCEPPKVLLKVCFLKL